MCHLQSKGGPSLRGGLHFPTRKMCVLQNSLQRRAANCVPFHETWDVQNSLPPPVWNLVGGSGTAERCGLTFVWWNVCCRFLPFDWGGRKVWELLWVPLKVAHYKQWSQAFKISGERGFQNITSGNCTKKNTSSSDNEAHESH